MNGVLSQKVAIMLDEAYWAGSAKDKGKLRMHTNETLLKGGRGVGSDIVIKGEADDSELIYRITLPKDDEEAKKKSGGGGRDVVAPPLFEAAQRIDRERVAVLEQRRHLVHPLHAEADAARRPATPVLGSTAPAATCIH